MFANFSAIVAGAAFGALLRYAFGLWFCGHGFVVCVRHAGGKLNWTGAYLIGLIAALLDCFPALSPNWHLLLITGFLGSLTTFSGFSLEIIGMLQAQRWGAAPAVVLLHLLGSLLPAALGLAAVQLFR